MPIKKACEISTRHNIPDYQAIAVVAILSPGLEWTRNLMDANTLIGAWKNHHSVASVGAYGKRNTSKAIRVLEGERIESIIDSFGSPKVWAFYQSILDPENATIPVIDQHIKAAMVGKRGK